MSPRPAILTKHLLLVLFAATLTFSPVLHSFQNADSILPVWMALERWTPFYWGQNRFGMPLALLPTLLRHFPWAAFFSYHFLLSLFSLGAIAWGFSYGIERTTKLEMPMPGKSFLSFILPLGVFLLIFPPNAFFEFWFQPYGASIGFLIPALILLRSPRRLRVASGVALLFVSFWINAGLIIFAFTLIVAEQLVTDRTQRRELIRRVGIFSGTFLVAWIAAKTGPTGESYLKLLPPAEWIDQWIACGSSIRNAFYPAIIPILGIQLVALLYYRKMNSPAFAFALTIASIIHFLFFALLAWTQVSLNSFRYFLPTVYGLTLSSCLILWSLVETRLETWTESLSKPKAFILAGGLVLSLTVLIQARFGAPSVAGSLDSLDQSLGKHFNSIRDAHCTHVIGDYWSTWTSVLYFRLKSPDAPIQGISFRALSNRKRIWASLENPNRVVCLLEKTDWTEADGRLWRIDLAHMKKIPGPAQLEVYAP